MQKTIDLTPTWEGVLRLLLAGYTDGSFDGRKIALEELTRMAKMADLYVASQKPPKPLGETENIGSIAP